MISGLKDRMLNISSSAKKIILASGAGLLLLAGCICTLLIFSKQISIVDESGFAKETEAHSSLH